MSEWIAVEWFPTRDGDYPSDWQRNRLADCAVVLEVYATDTRGRMWRGSMAISRRLLADAVPGVVGAQMERLVREAFSVTEATDE